MRFSIKTSPIGKPAKAQGDLARKAQGSVITYGWKIAEMTPAELGKHITSGKPFSPAIFKGGHRKGENFLSANMMALDLDKGEPIL